jgi:hypothetical protein
MTSLLLFAACQFVLLSPVVCTAPVADESALSADPSPLTPLPPRRGERGRGEGTARVAVEILEGIPDKRSWDFTPPEPAERYTEEAFGFVAVPRKWSNKAILLDRSNPYLLRATATIALPSGEYRILLRSRNAAKLFLDEEVLAETGFIKANASGHESVPDVPAATDEGVRALPVGHQEKITTVTLDGAEHRIRLESFIGGQKLRMELGELLVAVAPPGEAFQLLGTSGKRIGVSESDWRLYAAANRERMKRHDAVARATIGAEEAEYWQTRHELARREWSNRPAPAVPDVAATTPVHNAIDRFIGKRLQERGVAPAPLTDDLAFIRRVTLDTVGVIPTRAEIETFLNDRDPGRRARAIDRLLADPRWADHWVGYWQDVLAENPGILKPTLNNTGPFRWWIHQALEDNLPMDRFVTELVMMEGSTMYGGPAGFAMASLNDSPMAAKAHIAAKAFLGIELQCARCHDAPFHPYKQKELFSLAAMLGKGPQQVPSTSTVPKAERSRRPLVEVTLEPGVKVDPAWPFTDLAPTEFPPGVLRDSDNPRERLAAQLTSPQNQRFAAVLVNRLWKRTMGLGLVEPVDDWADAHPSHPELLAFLARELITHDYDFKHLARLILNSHTYQRSVQPDDMDAKDPESRLFAAPARRRMSAEQLVDSMFLAVGKSFGSEELCLDVDGRRPITEFLNLGTPRRAWEFTSLSNERDRPALSLPVAQSIVDVLTAYGWRESRQNPITVRDETPTPLQPLVLANGVVGNRITRLSDDSAITALCLNDRPLPDLVRAVYRQVLSRDPCDMELDMFVELLGGGYDGRRKAGAENQTVRQLAKASAVSWSNHLSPEATRLKLEQERAARAGDPPTARIERDWRERMEDMLWVLMNSPEFVFVP